MDAERSTEPQGHGGEELAQLPAAPGIPAVHLPYLVCFSIGGAGGAVVGKGAANSTEGTGRIQNVSVVKDNPIIIDYRARPCNNQRIVDKRVIQKPIPGHSDYFGGVAFNGQWDINKNGGRSRRRTTGICCVGFQSVREITKKG